MFICHRKFRLFEVGPRDCGTMATELSFWCETMRFVGRYIAFRWIIGGKLKQFGIRRVWSNGSFQKPPAYRQ